MKIGIGNDHCGVWYKQMISEYIREKYGYEIINFGTDSTEKFDYPISGESVANAVIEKEVDCGILICGTGVGISLAANKVRGIRCAVCNDPFTARMTKCHNDANMISFGARVIGIEMAKMVVDEFLTNEYEGGRHDRRLALITDIENRQYRTEQ